MTDLLAGKAALVTGGAHGIGREVVLLLAEQGARVLVADLDEGAARQTAADAGDASAYVSTDLADPAAGARIVAAALGRLGGLDVVVNGAGYNLNATVADMDDETWHRMFDIHVHAPFRVLRAAAPHFAAAAARDREDGVETFRKVVNVASIATMGSPGQANYAAAKAALVGLTKSLAREWADDRVNVNAVSFGSVATRLTAARAEDNVIEVGGRTVQMGLSERLMDRVTATVPYGRIATAREAAGGVLLLCLPWSDWVNGQVLVVSGGQVHGMSG